MSKYNSIECLEDDRVLLFIKNGYPVWDSKKNFRRFTVVKNEMTHLSKVYSDEYFFSGKDGYPNYFGEKEILVNRGIYYAEIIRKYTKPGKILDVGCAAGFILKGFESSGWESHGIEPNETISAYGRRELNLDIYTGSLENYESENRYDLVSLIQVIGHLYNIEKAFENISCLLNENGLVLVESWNMKSLIARVFGKHWHGYSPPSVVNWFSDESITKLFSSYGFKLIESGYPKKQITINHAMSILKYNIPGLLFQNRLMDYFTNSFGRYVINYPPFDIKWYIFRKQ